MQLRWNRLVMAFVLTFINWAAAEEIGMAITYQGHLKNGSGPVTDTCDFRFGLWDAAGGGHQVGTSPQTVSAVEVRAGVFAVKLDFGAAAINGDARWLTIEVQCSPDAGFVPLDSQRVELTPAPYAVRARDGVGPPKALEVDTATGRVGIGTSTPVEALDVAGVVRSSAGGFSFPDGTVLGSAPPLTPPVNMTQIATLRWDLLTGKSFVAGDFPNGIAFDGANIWIANANSNNVTKLRASDGANLGVFVVGTQPRGIAFDGSNIWVACYSSNYVTKLRASDGVNLGNFVADTGPFAVGFDGTNIWVANWGANTVSKLRALDGQNLGNFPAGSQPVGIAFDGANIWVSNYTRTHFKTALRL